MCGWHKAGGGADDRTPTRRGAIEMMKPTILTLATVLALSAAPAMAGITSHNTVSANGLSTNNTVVANGLDTHNTVAANGLNTNNTVVANGLLGANTVVANGLRTSNTRADNAVVRNEVHLVGATGAAVADGRVVVLRLVAVEYLPE
jgi:ABC-type oligopeptide transport system substrate-binding subunit